MRNPLFSEWAHLSLERVLVLAIIRHKLNKRLYIKRGVISSRPYEVSYVFFDSEGETFKVDKDDIFVEDK